VGCSTACAARERRGCFDYISSGSTFFAEFTGCNKTSPAVDREKTNRRALRQQQSWASAVEEFKAQHPDWIGGEQNKNLIGTLISENPDSFNGLTHLESLEKAYQHAVENCLLVENPEVAARDRIASANSVEEIRNLAHGGGVFNR